MRVARLRWVATDSANNSTRVPVMPNCHVVAISDETTERDETSVRFLHLANRSTKRNIHLTNSSPRHSSFRIRQEIGPSIIFLGPATETNYFDISFVGSKMNAIYLFKPRDQHRPLPGRLLLRIELFVKRPRLISFRSDKRTRPRMVLRSAISSAAINRII